MSSPTMMPMSLEEIAQAVQGRLIAGTAAIDTPVATSTFTDFSSVLMYCILFTLFTIITIRRPHPFRSRLVQISRYTQTVEQGVRDLADFLHMLGNPVGVISAGNSQSLERFLDLNYPLSILDVQRTMAVCAEDGAAAVILALSEETLNDDALQSVNVDVLGCDDKGLSEAEIVKSVARFGCTVGKQTHIAMRF